jgi:HAMP domain-containing protein
LQSQPRWGLRSLIFVCMIFVALAPFLIILPLLADVSRNITQRQAIGILQTTATAVAEQLGRDLQGQWKEVTRLAAFAEQGEEKALLRQRLETIVATNSQYAWLGLADPAGMVTVATGGVLEGASVIERPWFKAGLSGAFAGDVHGALLLQKYLSPNAAEPLRLIDFAIPVKRNGVPIGVLGAHVRWESVRELFKMPRAGGSIEIMLLARDGNVLIGPAEMEGKRLPLASALAAGQGISRAGVETWADGKIYLTTAIPALSFKDVPSFGWSLVARQPVQVALVDTYAATSRLLPVIGLCALGVIAVSFVIAWWLARPVGRLARAAESMSGSALHQPVPHERLYREAALLSDSLARIDSGSSDKGGVRA